MKDPSVSHYRLTIHLALAVALYALLFWTGIGIIRAPFKRSAPPELPIIGRLSLISCIAVTFTILYGGLVAGLKAGLIYNTFPLMGGQFIPDEWAFYDPFWLNFLENAALVQWVHRWLASGTVVLALFTAWKAWGHSPNKHTRIIALFFASATLFQAVLGVLTLLFQVPVSLGVLHQGTAVVVLSFGMYLYYLGKEQKKLPNFGLGRTIELV